MVGLIQTPLTKAQMVVQVVGLLLTRHQAGQEQQIKVTQVVVVIAQFCQVAVAAAQVKQVLPQLLEQLQAKVVTEFK